MRLTKLELYGFKSFARKTEILVDKGITAIVGPNGSGKSNIADAIRWVLGEQSAKTLRGSKMEDVIFSGTATRKPMSYCEVTLTFDNTDGLLPIDFSEVSIGRRLYRSGESEYYINKVQQRLKDLQELFRDTGLGKEGYSIVGQGKVEEILSNKSGDRRKAFEEAAGIMKYRVRKEASERDLDNTRKNLTRLSDILGELEERVEPLREQSETATFFLKLHDELRELEINLFLRQYDKVKERITNIKLQVEQLSGEINTIEEQRLALVAACQSAEDTERGTSDRLNALNATLVTMTAGLEELIGNLKVIDERISGADREHKALLARIAENEARYTELSDRLNGQNSDSEERELLLTELRASYDKANLELTEIQTATDKKEGSIEALKDAMFDAQSRLGDTNSQISALNATKASLEQRLAEMDDDNTDISGEVDSLTAELTEANQETAQLQSEYDETNSSLDAKISQSNGLLFERKNAEEQLRQAEQLFENKKSRYAALMEVKKAHDGYYTSIQKLLNDTERNSELKNSIEGTVAELIQVPQKYEIAIEMAMGASLQNIVTPNEGAAKYAIEHLRRYKYGRATFLPVSVIRPRSLTREERNTVLSVNGCIGIASELISFKQRYHGIVENLLGRTIIVTNLDVGVAINKLVGQSLRIATLDGDIINPGGSMTGGSTGKSFNILGRERECADLLLEINEIKKSIAEKTETIQKSADAVAAVDAEIKVLSAKKHDLEIELAKQLDKADIIASQLDRINNKHQQAQLERSRLCDSLEDITKSIEEASQVKTDITTGNATTQRDIVTAQQELAKLRKELATKTDEVTDLRVRVASLEKEANALLGEHARLEKDINALRDSIASDKQKADSFFDEQDMLKKRKAALELEIEEKRGENSEINDKCKSLEQERNALLIELDKQRKSKEDIEAQLDELKARVHQQELSLSRSEGELVSMQDKIWNDYELTYENAQQYRKDIPLTASAQRASELRKQIKALGTVNINAIEEFAAINERYTELKTQFEDLTDAEAKLVALIAELVEQMEINFRDKFKQICENFKKVFVELFGGGTAELILSDSNDILNCDIDILAQIPGKKLQSLSPLSGGERALTAIALQFAILGLKPTAFCLLDEIDASLDEENVRRFSDYIHVYSENTQFILITHRRGSMLSCNAMYGVSQEEKGVSKVVSARID